MRCITRQLALTVILLLSATLWACQAAAPTPIPPTEAPQTPVPTVAPATPTRAPTVRPTASPTPIPPTATPKPLIATAKQVLNIRSQPTTTGRIVGTLAKGATAQAVGRTAAGDWLQILIPPKATERGWIAATLVTLSGPKESLPVIGPGAPTPGAYPYP